LDWSLFHALNGLMRHRDGVQDAAEVFNALAIFGLIGIAGATWFFARPGGSPRSKLAALSAAAAAALALLANLALGHLWFHDRPFVDHPSQTVLLVHHAPDNSFPSDHASVAFAAAFAVLAFHRRLGLVLAVAAAGVALARIFVGVHYPVDVGASVLVGLATAVFVTTLAHPYVAWTARQLGRLSDPLVAAVHLDFARARRSFRRRRIDR